MTSILSFHKRFGLLFIILLFINAASGQISFEKGYYYNNDNNRIEGFIKNIDWDSNPTEIEFKSSLESDPITLDIESISSFGIDESAKYMRFSVMVDRSGHAIGQLDKERNPIFEEETLLLKVLVEGEYSLYEFVDRSLRRFFYSKKGEKPKQLVYKRYKLDDFTVGTNQLFKQQLKHEFECEEVTESRLKNLDYNKNDLKNFFIDINGCFGETSVTEYDKKKTKVNVYLKPGVSTNSIQTAIDEVYKVTGLIGYRFGVEVEFIFPFNKNKWAAVIEPNYRKVSQETRESNGTDIKVEFSSLEFPIGLRHYFFIDDKSKLFLDVYTNIEFGFKPSLTVGANEREGKAESNFSLGGGYNHKGLFSIGLRVETPQDILSNFVEIEGRFWSASLLIGVKL